MYSRLKVVISGWWFFGAILGVFALQAGFLALTSAFPMAFDERYHFTLIQYYSHTFNPIIATQPAELSAVGDATRLGSYLSHYLLSFPDRVVQLVTDDLTAQIVVLRLINVVFVIAALVLFRLFVARLTGSKSVANLSILAFCLLPVTSLLAAHINYDNLLLLMFAATLLSVQSIVTKALKGGRLQVAGLLGLMSLLLLGSLVKFTFLPVAVMLGFGTCVVLVWKRSWKNLCFGDGRSSRLSLAAMVVLVVGSMGLFVERYGTNVVTYGSPQPDCAAVQSLRTCLQYGPWARNHTLELKAATDTSFEGRSPQGYAANIWVPMMIRGLGGVDSEGAITPIAKPVLVGLMGVAAIVVTGMITAIVRRRDGMSVLFVLAVALYVAALMQRNYSEFMVLHEVVAVQGRYILPFVIPIAALGLIGLSAAAQSSYFRARAFTARVITFVRLEPREAYRRSFDYWSAKTWDWQ